MSTFHDDRIIMRNHTFLKLPANDKHLGTSPSDSFSSIINKYMHT